MSHCDICGAEGQLFRADIDGSQLNVCKNCTKFGKVIAPVRPKEAPYIIQKQAAIKKPALPEKEIIQVIVEDYAERVKKGREKLGLNQEDFAKKINERESTLHNVERGHFEPNIDLARKLEKFLKITLVENHEEIHGKGIKPMSDTFTIGDLINIKEKK